MELLEYWFSILRFSLEILTACFFFMAPLAKRPHFAHRAVLGGVLCLVVNLPLLLFQSGPLPLLAYVLRMCLALLLIFFCCNISGFDAFYCLLCAYATQHFAFSLHVLLTAAEGAADWTAFRLTPAYILVSFGTYLCFYFLFARRLPDGGHYRVGLSQSAASAFLILPFALVLNMAAKSSYYRDGGSMFLVCQFYAMLCCFFALWVQVGQRTRFRLQSELEMERHLARKQREQYEFAQENIAVINRKCHDLKHQVAALRTMESGSERSARLDELERSVLLYDCVVKTGNKALDTVLTEKSLLCEQRGISWTCMADGKTLNFMDTVDLYTLFGNALDNAIEGVSVLTDPARRVIAVNLSAKDGLLVLRIENYFEGILTFQDGLPLSTKGDSTDHGYGMKSIRATAEKYGGSVAVQARDGVFSLCLLLPLA